MSDTPHSLLTLLHHVSATYKRDTDRLLQNECGLGFSQYKILSSIQEDPALRQKHIAFELGQTEASVSRQVKNLQDDGLLMIRINPQNRREHKVLITPKGERVMAAVQEVLDAHQAATLRNLSNKQQSQLLDLLASIYR